MDSLSNLQPAHRTVLIYTSIAIQFIAFICSIITAAVAAKDLKFDFKDLRSCFLYMEGVIKEIDDPNQVGNRISVWEPTSSSSASCSAIQAITGIDALGSALVIITLIWLKFFDLQRSKTVFWILIGSGAFCGFIGFVAACMYSVGLKVTRDNSNNYFDLVLSTAGAGQGVAIESGRTASWIACISWMIYALIEFIGYRYYEIRFL